MVQAKETMSSLVFSFPDSLFGFDVELSNTLKGSCNRLKQMDKNGEREDLWGKGAGGGGISPKKKQKRNHKGKAGRGPGQLPLIKKPSVLIGPNVVLPW